MSPKSTQSSRSSLVSIDPVIANQITTSNHPLPSGHTRAGSSPIKIQGNHTTAYAKGHIRNLSAPIKHQGKRSNSLRRAKNSTDVLRQRSTKKDKDAGHGDNVTDTKRGRTFTVTNVGTGGVLYLRPSVNQEPISPMISPPPVAPFVASTATILIPDEKETELLDTQHLDHSRNDKPRTRSVSPKRLLQRAARAQEERAVRPAHHRSQSFSTLDESRKSFINAWPRTLKIVINRAGTATPSPDELNSKPSLEISIPHYRLGVPRFSTHGTPVLRNSTLSQTSSVPSIRQSTPVKAEAVQSGPPPASLKAFARLQSLDPSVNIGDGQNHTQRDPMDPRHSSYSLGSPVAPAIYDELSAHYNDPSVVRFAHDVRDVTAATPARIIAQISSESFMDYELVSDFFLTFRSYMSTAEVLDLLLARLAWAIGRMSDDGRIIRIRTFAALRHWILNYFMDDFVTHRRIRVRFCDEVNDLYNKVKSKQIGGPSDLKILQDLKRCWNGRCLLYWDGDEFDMDDNQDAEIHPGGIIGSRNPEHTDIQAIDQTSNLAASSAFQPPPLPPVDLPPPTIAKKVRYDREQPPVTSPRAPDSRHSEQSIQPRSCSILLKPMRSTTEAVSNIKRPHPVTVLERRQRAPSDLQVVVSRPDSKMQHHRRGGSSFDSTRARTPRETASDEVSWVEPYDGSIIRGFVFAPVEPFIHVPHTMPLSPSSAYDLKTSHYSSNNHSGQQSAASPAVKNIFGSIRRALSGRPGNGDVAMITISAPYSNQSLVGRKSPMPNNLSRSQDELRNKHVVLPPRSPIRIDLLCAAAIESYQAHVPGVEDVVASSDPSSMAKAATSLSMSAHHATTSAAPTEARRVLSHMTAESGSILIVDETGLGISTMSGALLYDQDQDGSSSLNPHSSSTGDVEVRHASYATQIAFDEDGNADSSTKTRESPSQDREVGFSEHIVTGVTEHFNSSSASTTTAKNRPSLNSSDAQLRAKASEDGTASAITAPQDYQDDAGSSQGPVQILRRMPGGDLRKNQNVHDLEVAVPHHESLDSVAETASSPSESLVIMSNAAPTTQTYKVHEPQQNQVSMINTHSSQHLRPSFEAAIAGFSSIPDDDDGGLETTLLKLEGLYDKNSPDLRQRSPSLTPSQAFSGSTMPNSSQSGRDGSSAIVHSIYTQRLNDLALSNMNPNIQGQHVLPLHIQRPYGQKQAMFGLPNDSVVNSELSHDSVPLLHRSSAAVQSEDDLLQEHRLQSPIRVAFSPILPDPSRRQELPADPASTHRSDSTRDLLRPGTSHTNQSFLLDEDENLSDLSSEMSVDIINYSEAMGSVASAMLVAPGTAVSGLEIPSHPLAHSSFVNLSMHPSLALDGGPGPSNKPLTPEPSPTMPHAPSDKSRDKPRKTQIPVGPAHIPFILACDSQMLAQQLTLIEQSALTEIDWSDLVEMRWSSKPAGILDWAEYVTKQDTKGVDLVITRFNLMVKWAISEIVLTQDIEERVRVITKFIHVAAHARRLRNYATMLQITIALTSADCTRLVKTWNQVSAPDKSLLKNMEALIQPIRNFHDLRAEMESADLTDGCIPFIGLYVHDLTYNAQKPAEIDAGTNSIPLINFERFRTAAVIVKGLLRFIDASSKYNFDPVHGIVERCLWIAALEDERIRALSKTLEVEADTT